MGESGIDGKLSLEGKLGPFLILSLVVGGQLGAKRAKLTPLRGLRGTKLELKGALGAPKEAPREAKRATVLIGRIAVCLIPCATHVPPRCKGRRRKRVRAIFRAALQTQENRALVQARAQF